ncbi:MAG: Hsp20/alpha crystallin family protein [Promethearchaeota archaeon]
MAIVQSGDKNIEENIDKPKYKVTPRYSAFLDKDKFILEIALPGISKENINIKALQDFFTLRAERDNITYTLDLDLSFKIEPEKVETKYNEGLLRVEFERFDPLAHAHTVWARKHEEDEDYIRDFPRMYKYIDYKDKKVKVEISIPGVKKEDIELKVRPTWFHLSAVRPADKREYAANQSFGVEVVPSATQVDYFEGLLKITAKIRDPIDSAKEITF